MSHRIDEDYDLQAIEVIDSKDHSPDNAATVKTRETAGPLNLNAAEQAALLDLISYLPHLDAFDFDNILEFLTLMYIADVQNSNYLKFITSVKKRFIEPLIPSLPPRHQHRERRIERLDTIIREISNIPFEDYQAAYARGALPLN